MSATTIPALTRESGCEVRMHRKAAAPTSTPAGPPSARGRKSLGLLLLAATFVPVSISSEVSATEGSFEAAVREELLRLGVKVSGSDRAGHSLAMLSRPDEVVHGDGTDCGGAAGSEGCGEAPILRAAVTSGDDPDLSQGMPSLQLSVPESAMDAELPAVSWDQDAQALAAALSQLTGMLATAKGRLEEIERIREELIAAKPVTQAERDEAVAELRLAQDELADLRKRHDGLMAEFAVVQDEHARLESEIMDRDGSIAVLKADAEKRSEVLETLQRSVAERDQEILALETEVSAAKDELDALRRAVASGNPVATDLTDTVQELASGLERYQQHVTSQDQEIQSLNDTAKRTLAKLESWSQYVEASPQPPLEVTHESSAPNLIQERDDATGAVTRYLAAFASASSLTVADPWEDPELRPLHRTLYRHQSKLAMLTDSRAVYTVKSDDYLSRIARHMYGENADWEKLYDANDHVLNDPDELIPGMVLIVP